MNYSIFLALFITFELGALSITQYTELIRTYKAQPTDARRKELVAEYHAFRADLDRRLADNALKVLLGKRISDLEQPAPAIPPAAAPAPALPVGAPTAAQLAQLRSEADDLRRALEKCQRELELCRSGAIEGTQLFEKELAACKTEVDRLKAGGGAQRDALIEELKKRHAAEMGKQMSALTNELEKCKAEIKQAKDQLAAQSSARTGIASGIAGALAGAGAAALAGGAGTPATEAQLKQCQESLAKVQKELVEARFAADKQLTALREESETDKAHLKKLQEDYEKRLQEITEGTQAQRKAAGDAAKRQSEEHEALFKKMQEEQSRLRTEASDAIKRFQKDRAKELIAQYSPIIQELQKASANLMKETDPIILAEAAARYQQIKEQLTRDIANFERTSGKSAPEPLQGLESEFHKIDLSLALQQARDLFEKVNAEKQNCMEELNKLQGEYESLTHETQNLREEKLKHAEEVSRQERQKVREELEKIKTAQTQKAKLEAEKKETERIRKKQEEDERLKRAKEAAANK